MNNINCGKLALMIEKGQVELVDVREKDEYDLVRIKGAKLIPLGDITSRLDEIDWKKEVVFYCRTGVRSAQACVLAAQAGRTASNLEGGIKACFLAGDFDHIEKTDNDAAINDYFS